MRRVFLAPDLPASLQAALMVRLQILRSTGAMVSSPCATRPLQTAQTGTGILAQTSGHSRARLLVQRPYLPVRWSFLKAIFAVPGHVLMFRPATP